MLFARLFNYITVRLLQSHYKDIDFRNVTARKCKTSVLYAMRKYNIAYFLYPMRKTLFRRHDYKVTLVFSLFDRKTLFHNNDNN